MKNGEEKYWNLILSRDDLFIQFRFPFQFHSLTSTCLVIVDLFAENFTQWPRVAATTTWPNYIRRLYHCVRCNACTVCTVSVPESMLSAGLCDSIFIRRKTTACTTNAWKVTYIFWFSAIPFHSLLCEH